MEQPRRCSHTGFWVVIGILSFILLISFAVNMGLMIGVAARGGATLGE